MGNASWVTLDTVDATRVAKNVPSETRTPVTMGEKKMRCWNFIPPFQTRFRQDAVILAIDAAIQICGELP